ncbi:hypothetical protein AB2L57_08315 [Microbacterium sp. HA-8]|uniref:hypothetical protein n=1 Tax=Microbacterium sp. HA-8 TaxID=3234200 RepID=UPI0038F779D2
MSYQDRPASPLQVRERAVCMCEIGASCTSYEPGHAVHLIQRRLVAATPGEWVDAIVESVDTAAGVVRVRDVFDQAPRTLFSAAGAANAVRVGEPVAVHPRYHVLARGAQRFNVRAD